MFNQRHDVLVKQTHNSKSHLNLNVMVLQSADKPGHTHCKGHWCKLITEPIYTFCTYFLGQVESLNKKKQLLCIFNYGTEGQNNNFVKIIIY